MLVSTLIAMAENLHTFAFGAKPDMLLLLVGGMLFFLALWLLVEAALTLRKLTPTNDPEVLLEHLSPPQGEAK